MNGERPDGIWRRERLVGDEGAVPVGIGGVLAMIVMAGFTLTEALR